MITTLFLVVHFLLLGLLVWFFARQDDDEGVSLPKLFLIAVGFAAAHWYGQDFVYGLEALPPVLVVAAVNVVVLVVLGLVVSHSLWVPYGNAFACAAAVVVLWFAADVFLVKVLGAPDARVRFLANGGLEDDDYGMLYLAPQLWDDLDLPAAARTTLAAKNQTFSREMIKVGGGEIQDAAAKVQEMIDEWGREARELLSPSQRNKFHRIYVGKEFAPVSVGSYKGNPVVIFTTYGPDVEGNVESSMDGGVTMIAEEIEDDRSAQFVFNASKIREQIETVEDAVAAAQNENETVSYWGRRALLENGFPLADLPDNMYTIFYDGFLKDLEAKEESELTKDEEKLILLAAKHFGAHGDPWEGATFFELLILDDVLQSNRAQRVTAFEHMAVQLPEHALRLIQTHHDDSYYVKWAWAGIDKAGVTVAQDLKQRIERSLPPIPPVNKGNLLAPKVPVPYKEMPWYETWSVLQQYRKTGKDWNIKRITAEEIADLKEEWTLREDPAFAEGKSRVAADLVAEHPADRYQIARAVSHLATARDIPLLERILSLDATYAACWVPAMEALFRLDPARAREVILAKSYDYVFRAHAFAGIFDRQLPEDEVLPLLEASDFSVVQDALYLLLDAAGSKTDAALTQLEQRPFDPEQKERIAHLSQMIRLKIPILLLDEKEREAEAAKEAEKHAGASEELRAYLEVLLDAQSLEKDLSDSWIKITRLYRDHPMVLPDPAVALGPALPQIPNPTIKNKMAEFIRPAIEIRGGR